MWTIRSGPEPGPWREKDAVGWRWEIERGEETRRLLVEVAGSAMASGDAGLPEETVAAKATQGRSAVEGVLDRQDPPGVITLGTVEFGRREEPYRAE